MINEMLRERIIRNEKNMCKNKHTKKRKEQKIKEQIFWWK
jgi:hypothetical protein